MGKSLIHFLGKSILFDNVACANTLQGDPLLKDLHTAVTLEEVKSYIALEHGQAITINLKRADDIVLRKILQFFFNHYIIYNASILLHNSVGFCLTIFMLEIIFVFQQLWFFKIPMFSNWKKRFKDTSFWNKLEITTQHISAGMFADYMLCVTM